MNRTVLTERQANLLATAMAIVVTAMMPSREGDHVFDDHVAGWVHRTLRGTRTPESATYDELIQLCRLLDEAGEVVLETAGHGSHSSGSA